MTSSRTSVTSVIKKVTQDRIKMVVLSAIQRNSEYLISVCVILKVFNLAPSGGKTIGNLGNTHISDHLKLNFWNTSATWKTLDIARGFPFSLRFVFFLLWVSPGATHHSAARHVFHHGAVLWAPLSPKAWLDKVIRRPWGQTGDSKALAKCLKGLWKGKMRMI